MTPPEQDETAVGSVLVRMGACTPEDVALAAELQRTSDEEARIGVFLVAHGFVTYAQLEAAVRVQKGLRSKGRYRKALAHAAIATHSSKALSSSASELRDRADEVKRKSDLFPVVARAGK